jgi:hypothetical protein
VKRRLFNAGALVSLALCLAVTGLWACSYWRGFIWRQRLGESSFQVFSFDGGLGLSTPAEERPGYESYGWTPMRINPSLATSLPPLWQFDIGRTELRFKGHRGPPLRVHRLWFPHWVLSALLAILPSHWLWRRWRRSRIKGKCLACGYDLRGTPGSKACPECGAEREAKA